MLFGRNPLRWCPAFTIKAVAFPGTVIWDTRYLDSEDFSGTLTKQFQGAMAFLKRNLRHVQRGQGFNSPGELEIPEIALEELLVNALVHRDYFTSASIRLLIFADRVEIISPGDLPDSLSVDDVRQGKTNRRNPTLTEHAFFGLLPYRGLGSGIPCALGEWPRIELVDDKRGNQFRAVIQRPAPEWESAVEGVFPAPIGQVTLSVTDPVTDPVGQLLAVLMDRELAPSAIQQQLGLKHRPTFRANYLYPALDAGLVEMTIPDKPQSRLQKYRLTAAGRTLLQAMQKGATKP